jgi:glutamate synthase domain-containing protein 1
MMRNVVFPDDKDFSGCSIFGMMNLRGDKTDGSPIIRAIANMKDRSNGLGGGFAVHGIYPELAGHYALHVMFDDDGARQETEQYIHDNFDLERAESIPCRPLPEIRDVPLLWRYFILPSLGCADEDESDDDFMVRAVMHINARIDGAFVFSSGRNMGVFKGVGYPEDIGRFFRLDEYEGYLWVAHGRFPTNTQGWWGGAHPFNILDMSVVHNGEISSYGTNRRFLEMYGYDCTLHTDTEVLAYGVDLLMRRHGLSIEDMANVFASPMWEQVDRMPLERRKRVTALRQVYSSLLMNGPFSIIVSSNDKMIGLTDRIRLRPLVAGRAGDMLYISSEEAPIHLIQDGLEDTWTPSGGEPIIFELGTGIRERELVTA